MNVVRIDEVFYLNGCSFVRCSSAANLWGIPHIAGYLRIFKASWVFCGEDLDAVKMRGFYNYVNKRN